MIKNKRKYFLNQNQGMAFSLNKPKENLSLLKHFFKITIANSFEPYFCNHFRNFCAVSQEKVTMVQKYVTVSQGLPLV